MKIYELKLTAGTIKRIVIWINQSLFISTVITRTSASCYAHTVDTFSTCLYVFLLL